MGKFKVGDKVKIRKDSKYYGYSEFNPADTLGEIIEIYDFTEETVLNIRVLWENDTKNSYSSKDLELAEEGEVVVEVKKTPFLTQEGGDHYKTAIQPIEYIQANNLGYLEGNVIKYVSRYKRKNGIEDLKKARHYIDFLIHYAEKEE